MYNVTTFTLSSREDGIGLRHRSSQTRIDQTRSPFLQGLSRRSVREYDRKDSRTIDLPSLKSMILDSHAFMGDNSADRRMKNTYPYYYRNTLTMRS